MVGSDSAARLMAAYPGGWRTVFPNGGDAATGHGAEWGTLGEVWLTPFYWDAIDDDTVVLTARLVLSPFGVVKTISVRGDTRPGRGADY